MKRISLVLFFLLVCLPFVFAQKINPPCCDIVSVDGATGIVTARDLKSGRTFKFEVDSRSLTRTLRPGQKVWVNAATRKAGFTDSEPCCGIAGNVNLDFANKGSTSVAASAAGAAPGSEQNSKWEIKRNPDLKGAMGRIIVRPPEKAVYTLAIFKAGTDESSASGYIGRDFLLLPGEYDTRWWNNSEWKLRGVPVKRGMDTRIRAGMLNINLPSTSWVIYDETKKFVIEQGYSTWPVGLPVGKYYVKVNNDFGEVIIKDGAVTEF